MSSLIRHYQPSTRLDHEELDGLLNRIDREIAEHGEHGDMSTAYLVGAEIALTIIRHHEYVDNQDTFMALFFKYLQDLGGD